ncbi:MAG: ester cyclase [Alphaproteobacteria bacterium]|nr:ester cyclase [Alphaproteobacteria bacterium]
MTRNLFLSRKGALVLTMAAAFALFAMTLAGCEQAGNAAAQKKAEELFDKWQMGWNTHNVDLLMEVAAETDYWDVTLNNRISGEDFRKHAEAFLVAMPDVNFSLDEVTVTPDGKEVIWRWTWTGTFTGPLGETQPTGKKVEGLTGADFLYIEDGKIKKVDIYWNQLELLTQMGLLGG